MVKLSGWQEAGFAGALLQRPRRPSALFCVNDGAAMGALDAARELGLGVPEQLSIIGFDNQELIAAHLGPRLTTMQLPHYEMGAWGVRALLCPLVRRESVQPPGADFG